MVTKSQETDEISGFEEQFSQVITDLGGARQLKITANRRNPDTKKLEYARSSIYDANDGDPIEDLYDHFPMGGEFRLTIQDNNNKGPSKSFWITLAERKPKEKEVVKTATQPAAGSSSDRSNTDLMLAMMTMNNQSAQSTMQMMTSVLTALITSGNKNSSDPASLLDSVISAHKSLIPQDNSSDFDKMLDRVSKMRELTEIRENPGGVAGVLSSFAPMLAALATQQTPQLPAPQAFARPAQTTLPQPQVQPVQQPQVTQDQEAMLKKLSEVISAAKFYIDRDYQDGISAEELEDIAIDICDYLIMQRSIGNLSDAEIHMALSQRQNLSMILQYMQMTDAHYVTIIDAGLQLFAEALAGAGPQNGTGGQQANTGNDGHESGPGQHNAVGANDGPVISGTAQAV